MTQQVPNAYANRLIQSMSRDPNILNKLERPTDLGDNNNTIQKELRTVVRLTTSKYLQNPPQFLITHTYLTICVPFLSD